MSLSFYISCCKKAKREFPLYIITTAKKRDKCEWQLDGNKLGLDCSKFVIDSWNNITKYEKVKDSFFIFDEQRAVGNGKWSKSFIKIAKANIWIMLTATPGDCWEDFIPVFIANGFYKNRTEFYKKHVVFDRFFNFPKILTYINTGELIKHKNDILVEMEKTETVRERVEKQIVLDFDRDLYKTVCKNRWNPFLEKPIMGPSDYCSVLRKICNTNENKLNTLEYLFESSQTKRFIIFYNFNYELDMLREWCEKKGIEYAEWNGQRHELIPKTDEWIYLTQYSAGCEGWNCIDTNTIIFFSINYSYKQMTQAAGRIDRFNSPYKVLYYYYLTTNSDIDESIRKALDEKRDFNEKSFYRKSMAQPTDKDLNYFENENPKELPEQGDE